MIEQIFQKKLKVIRQMHHYHHYHHHYWYFKDIDFKHKPYFCNGCHDLVQKAINFNDVAIVSVKEGDYRINFWYISKNDAINKMKNSNLNEKKWIAKNVFIIYKNR